MSRNSQHSVTIVCEELLKLLKMSFKQLGKGQK
jgi:hypothetical protein